MFLSPPAEFSRGETPKEESEMSCDHIHKLPPEILNDPESFRIYLTEYTLLGMQLALEKARREAGFTEQELAQKLHWKVSKVKRYERDVGTHITLRSYVRWLAACGVVPPQGDPASIQQIHDTCCQESPPPPVLAETRGDS